MFHRRSYIKYIFLLILHCLLNFVSYNGYSQCSALTSNVTIDFQTTGQCAPVEVTSFDITYKFSIAQNVNDIEIVIDWDDPANNSTVFSLANGNLTVSNGDRDFQAVGTFPYPTNESCRFEPFGSISVNGTLCTGSNQPQTVNSWSEDNDFGASIAINPNQFNVCEGDGFSNIRFEDNSIFNCNIAVEPDDPNQQPRFIQFIYGTNHNPTEGIRNLTINDGGIVNLTDVGGALNGITTINGMTGTYFGPIEEVPFPANNPISETFPFSLADNPFNVEDDYFEVTMVNWNTCNPYNGNPANPNYADAIMTTARIVMVGDPTTTIQFRNQNNTITDDFCPGDQIRLRQDGGTTGGTGNFEYRWEVFDGSNDGETIIYSSGGFNNNINRTINAATTNGFSGGTKLVRLYIEDQDAEGNCVNTIDETLTITAAPTAIIDYDYEGNTGTDPQQEICLENFTSNQLILNSINTVDNSGNGYSEEWELYRRRNNIADFPANPDSTFTSTNASITLNLTNAGVYRARLNTEDDVTGCATFDDFSFVVYDQPIAEFDASEVCLGDDVIFEDLSSIPTSVEGENINSWEFVFDFDSTNFKADPEGTFDTEGPIPLTAGDFTGSEYPYTYPAAGTYYVALRVTTDNGCVSPVDTMTVVVKENPLSNFEFADNGIDYTQDLCPGTPIEIKNTSPAGQTDPTVDRFYVEIISQDNNNNGIFPTPAPTSFVAPGDSAIINPTSSDLPNPFSAATYTYDFYFIAVGDNNCETREGPLSVTFLPSKNTDFDIFTDNGYSTIYNPADEFCSPNRYYFKLDSDVTSDLSDNDSLVWTITDITNSQFIKDTTVLVDPLEPYSPDTLSFNFVNEFPEIGALTYRIDLQPYVDGICYDSQEKTVRVLPKPTSDFIPTDTVVTCDSVTYYFEAIQPGLLNYDWQVQTAVDTLSTQNKGADFWVSYARPDDGNPAVNVEVRLQTENPFNCQSDLSDPFNDTILPKDNISVELISVGNDICAPAIYGFINQTTDPVPAGTEWELVIKNLDINDSTIIEGTSLPSNTDFRATGANLFEYEFTDSANYEIRLNALLPSTCDVASDPPISLTIGETPEVRFTTNISEGCAPLQVTIINESSALPSGRNFNISYEVRKPNGDLVFNGGPDIRSNTAPNDDGYNNLTLPPLLNTESPFIDYELTIFGETFAGCSDDSTVVIRVYQDPAIDFNVLSPNPACQEDYNFEFEIDPAIKKVPPGTEFTWNWGDGQSLTTDQDTVVNHLFSNRASFFGDDSYTVTLTALTPNNCTISVSKDIDLNPRIQAQFNASTLQGCNPLNVTFTSTSLGTNIIGGHEYFKRLQGATVWDPIDSVSSSGTVSELFLNNTTTVEIWEILYIVEGEGGCRDTADIKEITVFPSPEFEIDVLQSPLCQVDDGGDYEFEFELSNLDVPAGTEFTWNWGDGSTPLVTTSPINQTHIFNNRLSYFGTDNYTVTVSAQTPNGCILNETVSIQLFPLIEAIFFKNQNEGCAPLEVEFSSSSLGTGLSNNYIYQQRLQGESNWNTIAGTSANGLSTFTFENEAGNDLIYEVRHLISSAVGNCMDTSDIQEITVFSEFDSPAINGPNEVCSFAQSVVYNVPTTSTSTYNWSLPQGAFITNQNTNGSEVEINFSSFSGNIELIEVNENGCFGSPSILPIAVLAGPTVSLSLNGPNTICPGDETSLRFNLTGEGSQGFDVIYSNGQETDTLENIQNGHIETITPTESRNYFVLDVIDRQYPDCSAANVNGSAFINVNFSPTATLSGNATICEDGSTNLFINLTGAGPWDVTYTDGNSNFIIEDISSPVYQLQVSPTENTLYELVSVTDSNTPVCTGTVSGNAAIAINPKPTAVISGNFNNICAGDFVELSVALTGFEPWTVRYTDGQNIFTIPNITPSTSFDPETDTYNHSFEVFPTTGTTNYTLVDVRDSNSPSCLGDISGTSTVTVFERPTAEITGNATICNGESSAISFGFTGDGPFDIELTANQDTLVFENLNNGQTIDFSPEITTTYRLISLSDQRGCLGNSLGGPISINVNQLPSSEISGNDVTCFGEETELIFDQTGVGPWTITYTDGNENYSFNTAFNRHFEPVFPETNTTYSLVSVVDSNSPNRCSGTVSGTAFKEVFPQLEANFDATPEEMVLPQSTVTITNNTTNKNEWEYEWDFGDGTISTEVDPAPYEYGTFGTFVIRMTATNGQCTDTYQTSVTIGAIPPIVDFDAAPTEGCLPLVVEFENLTRFADPSTYQWEFGDGQRAAAVENPTHVYRNPGTYTVTLSATNITGQRTQMVKEEFILVNETPEASFTIPDEYRQVFTTEEVRFVNLSEGADEFIWKFGDGNESFEEEPIHAYQDSGIYNITLIAINTETGCTDSVSLSSQVQVILGGESDVPNAFTPSRAGQGTASSNPLQNDFFLPKVEGVSQFNMKIYNRWGELLFESNDRTVGWDGYYNGVLMPQGVYVYRLELVYENGRRETKVGDITLIR